MEHTQITLVPQLRINIYEFDKTQFQTKTQLISQQTKLSIIELTSIYNNDHLQIIFFIS